MSTPDLLRALELTGDEPPAPPKSRRPHQTNKGRRFPPDPIAVEDIVALLEACTPRTPGRCGELAAMRLRALIAVLWRTGMRISEALALEERDLARQDLAIVIRRGKGDKRRLVAMDEWGWRELEHWLGARRELAAGAIFCVVRGRNAGSALFDADVRRQLREAAAIAGLRRRANPHSFRHEHAVELWREGVDTFRIQQQLGHARLDVTANYLRGVAPVELLEPIGHRRPPMMMVPTHRR